MREEKKQKLETCHLYFQRLAEALSDTYEIVESSRNPKSKCLVPKGTADRVTYDGKPEYSFRVSDTWNWHANKKDCPNGDYLQCYCKNMPYPNAKRKDGKASKPVFGCAVAIYINNEYHVIYGETFNRKTHEWNWEDLCDPECVANIAKGKLLYLFAN